MSSPTRLGVPPHSYCLPLIEGLENDAAFELSIDATTKNAIKLRHRQLDAAFLSPIDYARESSEYLIVPTVAVASRKGTESVVLHFREGLHTITTLAVDPSSTSEIILAKILLAEIYDCAPAIVPTAGTLDDMLSKADAVLLIGDDAVNVATVHANKLDLVEEWNDLLDLPYVHGFWCGREHTLSLPEIEKIRNARDKGVLAFDRLASDAARWNTTQVNRKSLETYLQGFTYDFTDDVREGLSEFLRYAFYHGVLPDVADVNFYSTNPDDSEISLN